VVGRRKSQVPTRQEIIDLLDDARRRRAKPELPLGMHKADLHGLDLRGANLTGADLRGANLTGAHLGGARLTGADLTGAGLGGAGLGSAYLRGAHLRLANLAFADLTGADLTGADLTEADPIGAHFQGADLAGANLRGAHVTRADLTGADLRGADLRGAYLTEADLAGANLTGADLAGSHLGFSILANVDLSGIRNLARVVHAGPTEIGTNTLERTAAGLATQPASQRNEVFDFLRKAGVRDDLLTLVRSWIGNPIEFYSCFISYSHADKEFARLLYDTLQGRGIRCWLDEHQLLPGDNIADAVDRGIRLWDKVLICCSKTALTSWWVDDELEKAFEKERRLQKERGKKTELVIPLDLDGFLFKWDDGKAAKLLERYAPSFTGWGDTKLFGQQVDQVIKALRSDAGAREEPPSSKL
jgi:hypothetical protein